MIKSLNILLQKWQIKRRQRLSPDAVLNEAKRELRDYATAVRQQTAAVLKQMERLGNLLKEQEQRINDLDQQIESALAQGNTDLTRNLLKEKTAYQDTAHQTKITYDQAREAVDALDLLLKKQERSIRERAAKALAGCEDWDKERIEAALDSVLKDAAHLDSELLK